MDTYRPLRAAICSVGLDTYWDQFPDLRPALENYLSVASEKLRVQNVELFELGLLDNTTRAREAASVCRQNSVELLFIYVVTYTLSSTILQLVQRAAVPVVILNLQPAAAIDYNAFNALPNRRAMTGHWLKFCSACPVPEIGNLFARAGIPFHQVTGVLYDDRTWQEIYEWIAAGRVASSLRNSRMGLMGHYYSGMLDVTTDVTQLAITFGVDLDLIEVDELSSLRENATEIEVSHRILEIREHFDVQPDCFDNELARAAVTSLALDHLVGQHRLDLLAYYYKGSGNTLNEDTMSSIILGTSLLTARHIPVAGEYEVKNVVAMKIMDILGAGGSFTEYYALDLTDDIVLMGHDGPGHTAIAQGKTKVRPLDVYHGKVGRGLSVEMSVRHGPVTLLSVAEDRQHGFKFVVAEGTCESGPTLAIGNTNSRYRFSCGSRNFVEKWNEQGPAHHCAVGVGHLSSSLRKLGELLSIPATIICTG